MLKISFNVIYVNEPSAEAVDRLNACVAQMLTIKRDEDKDKDKDEDEDEDEQRAQMG